MVSNQSSKNYLMNPLYRMLKPLTAGFVFLFLTSPLLSQSKLVAEVNAITPPAQALYPLRFLASDELMGRGTTRQEIHTAARYISEEFRSLGLKQPDGTADYFQPFEIKLLRRSTDGSMTVNGITFTMGKDLVQLKGMNFKHSSEVVYLGYGTAADWTKADVKEKLVLVDVRADSAASVRNEVMRIDARQKFAQDHGAAGLIVRFQQGDVPWSSVQNFFQRERVLTDPESNTPVFMIDEHEKSLGKLVGAGMTGSIRVEGNNILTIPARNVMGYVEGTDPDMKDEFIVLSAHYDHLGVAPHAKTEEGKMDSIYNGARDNAIGVAAVMNAARYFAKRPAKRSVLFIAYTAEEMGLGGSKYFSDHPTVPLDKIVYNLNIDNGGYNDTTLVTIVGLRRTSADDDMKKACSAYGLKVMSDPAPQQNLFDRSDNVSLAAKGIPAPTFSMGFTSFDESIMKRYHQLSDEIGDLNMSYVLKYIRAYTLAAKYIADNPDQPEWKPGDKYEAAWKALYRK
jgi:hypothetical protein